MNSFGLGAVGLVDALGFKGIWKRHDVDLVVEKLRSAKQTAMENARVLAERNGADLIETCGEMPEISAIAFSDTVAITATVPGSSDPAATLSAAAGIVAVGLGYLMRRCAQGEVPLVFRGAIATGECFVAPEENMLLGQAIDDAFDLMNLAEGAFVWLAPKTAELDLSRWEDSFWTGLLSPYAVPIKGGRVIRTKVVSPLVHLAPEAEEFKAIRAGYSSFLRTSNSVDVVVKKQNTEDLLDHLQQEAQAKMDRAGRRHAEVRERMEEATESGETK